MATAYAAPVEIVPPDFDSAFDENGKFDHDRYREAENNYIETLIECCRKNGNSPLLGEMIKWQRGDGYACYLIWDVKPLELIHLEIGDAWQVEDALIRGLRLADVKEMVEREKNLRALFGHTSDR